MWSLGRGTHTTHLSKSIQTSCCIRGWTNRSSEDWRLLQFLDSLRRERGWRKCLCPKQRYMWWLTQNSFQARLSWDWLTSESRRGECARSMCLQCRRTRPLLRLSYMSFLLRHQLRRKTLYSQFDCIHRAYPRTSLHHRGLARTQWVHWYSAACRPYS